MAYVSQELKAKLAPKIKEICKKYGVKASLSVHHHSTLVLNVSEGPLDFFESYNRVQSQVNQRQDYIQVNPYWFQDHFDGKPLEFLKEVKPAMSVGNHDNSDIQSDYFDIGWYININIGQWDKPYKLIA